MDVLFDSHRWPAVLSIPGQLDIPAAHTFVLATEDANGSLPIRGDVLDAADVLLIRKLRVVYLNELTRSTKSSGWIPFSFSICSNLLNPPI